MLVLRLVVDLDEQSHSPRCCQRGRQVKLESVEAISKETISRETRARLYRRAAYRPQASDFDPASAPRWPADRFAPSRCSARCRVDPPCDARDAERYGAPPRCSASRACGGTLRRLPQKECNYYLSLSHHRNY